MWRRDRVERERVKRRDAPKRSSTGRICSYESALSAPPPAEAALPPEAATAPHATASHATATMVSIHAAAAVEGRGREGWRRCLLSHASPGLDEVVKAASDARKSEEPL